MDCRVATKTSISIEFRDCSFQRIEISVRDSRRTDTLAMAGGDLPAALGQQGILGGPGRWDQWPLWVLGGLACSAVWLAVLQGLFLKAARK